MTSLKPSHEDQLSLSVLSLYVILKDCPKVFRFIDGLGRDINDYHLIGDVMVKTEAKPMVYHSPIMIPGITVAPAPIQISSSAYCILRPRTVAKIIWMSLGKE